MSMIKVFARDSREYSALVFAASAMTLMSSSVVYEVGDTFFDYGQNWRWTTIIATPKNRETGWQALSPRQHENILLASSPMEILNALEDWRMGDYNPDKSVRA